MGACAGGAAANAAAAKPLPMAHNAAHRGRIGEGQWGGSNGRIWARRGSSAITKQVGHINSE